MGQLGHLADEGHGGLAEGLGVADVTVDELLEGVVARALLELLLDLHRAQHNVPSDRILGVQHAGVERVHLEGPATRGLAA